MKDGQCVVRSRWWVECLFACVGDQHNESHTCTATIGVGCCGCLGVHRGKKVSASGGADTCFTSGTTWAAAHAHRRAGAAVASLLHTPGGGAHRLSVGSVSRTVLAATPCRTLCAIASKVPCWPTVQRYQMHHACPGSTRGSCLTRYTMRSEKRRVARSGGGPASRHSFLRKCASLRCGANPSTNRNRVASSSGSSCGHS